MLLNVFAGRILPAALPGVPTAPPRSAARKGPGPQAEGDGEGEGRQRGKRWEVDRERRYAGGEAARACQRNGATGAGSPALCAASSGPPN